MTKRTESSKEETQKGKVPKTGNNPKSSKETKKQTDNNKNDKKSARLNFYLIYSALRKGHGKKLIAKEILNLLNDQYDIKMERTTIQRILADVCYDLLIIEETEKLIPFYVYCEFPFDENIQKHLNTSIEKIIEQKIKENIITPKDRDEEINKAKKYFPITKSEEKEVLKLHFPLRLSQYIEEDNEFEYCEYKEYLECFFEQFKKGKNAHIFPSNVKFSIEEDVFTDVEQKMLMDAIEAYAYISKKDTAEFMEKLDRISTGIPLNKYKDLGEGAYPGKVESVAGDDGETFFDNLSAVIKAISNNHKVEILYGEYDVVGSKPMLDVRSNYKTTQQNEMIRCAKKNQYNCEKMKNHKCNKNNCNKSFFSSPKIISPYNTMWANGYYYLIASFENHPDNISALRMDRILDVNEIEEQRDPVPEKYKYALVGAEKQEFSAQQIANKAVVMHTEVPQQIEFECKKYMLNNVVDGFGFEISLQEPERDRQDWIKVCANASLSGAALWLTQHCADSVAISPEDLVEKVITNLDKGTQHYNDRKE